MQTENKVKQIIEYLQEKIKSLEKKIKDYDGPIMQELAKNSPHLQYDYTRLKAQLESTEDDLRVIMKFAGGTVVDKTLKKKTPGKKKETDGSDQK